MTTLTHEPVSLHDLTFDVARDRLQFAGWMASDDVLQAHRWAGWFTFQTGIELPVDIFEKYASALDVLDYLRTSANTSRLDLFDQQNTVNHYEGALTAIILGHLPLKAVA